MYNISISCNCPSNININYTKLKKSYKGDIYFESRNCYRWPLWG